MDVQQQIPKLFCACVRKLENRAPTNMQFIIHCFPSVSEQVIMQNWSHFETDTCNVTIKTTLSHLLGLSEKVSKALFEKVVRCIHSYNTLYELIDTLESVKLPGEIKIELVHVLQNLSQQKILGKLKDIRTKLNRGISDLEDILTAVKTHDADLLQTIIPKCEELIIIMVDRSLYWEKDQITCLIRLCARRDIFTHPNRFDNLMKSSFSTRKPDIVFGVFKGYLEKEIEGNSIDVIAMGKKVMVECFDKTMHFNINERIFQAYRNLHELENSRFARCIPGFIDAVHQCINEKLFDNMSSRLILKCLEQIPEGEDEIFSRLRQDCMDATDREFDELGKKDLNAWIIELCGENLPITIDRE